MRVGHMSVLINSFDFRIFAVASPKEIEQVWSFISYIVYRRGSRFGILFYF
jgi:hypothetical protein